MTAIRIFSPTPIIITINIILFPYFIIAFIQKAILTTIKSITNHTLKKKKLVAVCSLSTIMSKPICVIIKHTWMIIVRFRAPFGVRWWTLASVVYLFHSSLIYTLQGLFKEHQVVMLVLLRCQFQFGIALLGLLLNGLVQMRSKQEEISSLAAHISSFPTFYIPNIPHFYIPHISSFPTIYTFAHQK